MKKTILAMALLAVAAQSMAYIVVNPKVVCIYNHTNNAGRSSGAHWLQAEVSPPGVSVPQNHWGLKADYNDFSCVSMSALNNGDNDHVYSVGQGLFADSYTDCNGGVNINKGKQSDKIAYFESTQMNGHTVCNFRYLAKTWHG